MQVHSHPTQPQRFHITVATVKTIQGKPISEDQVDAWVTEAKNSYAIEFLFSRELTAYKVPGLVWTVMQDPEGNEFCALEIVVLRWDDGTEAIIHSMKARKQYRSLLD